MPIDQTLYKRLGGQATLQRVHKIFYDKVYDHPWLSLYFQGQPQEVLESQQTEFMGQLFGGPKVYWGKTPKIAHQHMVISEELFELRHSMLADSIREAGVADGPMEEWLIADRTFIAAIVKQSAEECKRSFSDQQILDFPRPVARQW